MPRESIADVTPPQRTALLFGEALIDEFADRRVVAGAPVHVATLLARRGWRSVAVTRVGRDDDGRLIARELSERGVDTSLLQWDDVLPTGVAGVSLGPGGPAFEIRSPAAWDGIVGPDRLPDHDALYYGTLAARSQPSADTLFRILDRSEAGTRVMDANLRPPYVDPGVIARCLAHATVAKVTGEEHREISALCGLPDTAAWFDKAPSLELLCVTHGAKGAEIIARDGKSWSIEPRTRAVGDTVGAGDAFIAALTDALARAVGPDEALASAHAAAAAHIAGG